MYLLSYCRSAESVKDLSYLISELADSSTARQPIVDHEMRDLVSERESPLIIRVRTIDKNHSTTSIPDNAASDRPALAPESKLSAPLGKPSLNLPECEARQLHNRHRES